MDVGVKWLCLQLTVFAVAVYGRLDVNVALSRTSFQSSLYSDPSGTYPASNANDGNHQTHLAVCSHTNTDTNPWWAVDLLVALYVVGVKFTNRYNSPERSDNFIIGLTSVSPSTTAPTLWNYAVCGQYPGAVGPGATVSLQCTSDLPAYRYLVVQFPATDKANFCELEVYVRRWEWASRPGQKMINKVASTIQVDFRLQCMLNCTLSPICDSYNYRPSDKTCQLNTL